jgi:hypothetical protein
LAGKTVVLFATSGGSRFGKTVANLKGSCSDTTKIIEGKILNSNASKDELTAWVASL